MNEQNQADAKLREAAEKMYPKKCLPKERELNRLGRENLFEFAKSEAAKEYWQSQQTKVDVENLKKEFENVAYDLRDKWDDNLSYDKIFNWFLPHLQLTVEKTSDSIEFVEWSRENYNYDSDTKTYYPIDTFGYPHEHKSGFDIYTEFKNQKG